MAPPKPKGRSRPSTARARPVFPTLPRFISFPLEKFSYATLRTKDDKHTPYQHETSRNELFLVFDTSLVSDEHKTPDRMLKVLRGTQRLEILNLNEKIDSALRSRDGLPFSASEPQSLPLIALLSSPKLAMRYVTDTGMVRRFQCCFSNADDFDVAINFLRSVGWPVTDAASNESRQNVLHSRSGNGAEDSYTRQDGVPDSKVARYLGKQSTRELTAMASTSGYATHQSNPNHRSQLSSQHSGTSILDTGFQTPPRSSSQLGYSAETQDVPLNYHFPSSANVPLPKATRPTTAPSAVNAILQRPISSNLDRLENSVNNLSPLPQPTFLTPARNSDVQKHLHQKEPLVAENPYLQRPQSATSNPLPRKRSHQAFQEHDDPRIEHSSQPIGPRTTGMFGSNAHTSNSQPHSGLIDPDIDLAAYAALPQGQRTESLDNWILAKLNDESFLQLLEDMQRAWRRIGLNRY